MPQPPYPNTLSFRRLFPLLWTFVLLVTIALPTQASHGKPLELTPSQHEADVAAISQYLEDADGKLTIEQLIHPDPPQAWRPVAGTSWSFGFTHSVYWFRFDVINRNPPQADSFLEIHYPLLDNIELYTVQQGKVIQQAKAGDDLPFSSRPYKFRNFLFKPHLPQGQTISIYLRVKSSGSMLVPVLLWHEHDFYVHEEQELLIHGIYFGVLLVFILHNILLFRYSRQATYLHSTFYLSGFGLFQASLFGLGYQYLWPESPTFQHYSIPLFMLLSLFSALRFAHHFLHLERTCPRGVGVLRAVSAVPLLLLVALPFIPYSLATEASLLLVVLSAVLLMVIAAVVWFRFRGDASYFFLAWFLFLVGAIISAAGKLGWGGLGTAADHFLQLGVMLQIAIFSLALAKRMQAERELRIAMQQQTTRELEKQVRARTAELEEANRLLDAMSHTDGLTGLKNRRLFDEEFERQFKAAQRNHTQLSLAMLDIDHFKKLNDTYGHLVGDDFLRLISAVIATEIKRPLDTACRYGGEEFALILPETPPDGALTMAECIRSGVEEIRHRVGEKWVPVTISIGISTLTPSPTQQKEELVQRADKALYQAKTLGRNRVVSS